MEKYKIPKARILIVEDDQIIALDIVNKLTKIGYSIAGMTVSGDEAIDQAGKTRPDLVLMDIVLKGKMTGVTAAREILRRYGIPVVYLTAYMDEKFKSSIKKSEPFGYILKPCEEKILDITLEMALYRYHMEQKLKASEQKYKTLTDNINVGIYRSSPELKGKFLEMNSMMVNLFGYKSKEELHRQKISALYQNPGDRRRFVEKMKKNGLAINEELNLKKKNGQRFIGSVTSVAVKNESGKVLFFDGIIEDITKRKRVEQDLKKSREQLRSLARHLESVIEHERTNMAREIHDELGQSLTALKMDTTWLMKKIPENLRSFKEKMKSMLNLIDNTIQTVKRISTELRPGLLDDLGLSAAIEWQADEFQKRTGIDCQLNFRPEEIILDEKCSTEIFRIFQEALTNIARHAQATRVAVSLIKESRKIELEVKDNGRGITVKQLTNPKSFGLLGIKERVHFLEGDCKINSTENGGTTISVSIPLEKRKK